MRSFKIMGINNFINLCQQRYSVRNFLSKEIAEEKIDYILECARLAPSAVNYQPWIFYIVENKEVQQKLHKAYDREWFATAPLYIVVCKDSSQSWKRTNSDAKDHGEIDASIVSTHICLAAHEVGLGTCWVCNFDPILIKKALVLKEQDNLEPIVVFPIGYIDTEKSKIPTKKRKELSEIVRKI